MGFSQIKNSIKFLKFRHVYAFFHCFCNWNFKYCFRFELPLFHSVDKHPWLLGPKSFGEMHQFFGKRLFDFFLESLRVSSFYYLTLYINDEFSRLIFCFICN